ncbi:MAG: phasin family protein, partial [Proteobacteria bacterium]|nr:phasin family protein [Pseudomonadota bacterium]
MNQPIATPEHFLSAIKNANAAMAQLAATSFDAMEKQIDLNLKTARSSLADAAEASSQMLGVKDAQELYGVAQGA